MSLGLAAYLAVVIALVLAPYVVFTPWGMAKFKEPDSFFVFFVILMLGFAVIIVPAIMITALLVK